MENPLKVKGTLRRFRRAPSGNVYPPLGPQLVIILEKMNPKRHTTIDAENVSEIHAAMVPIRIQF